MARAEGLSPSELRFVRDGIAADLRGDGRTRAAFRTVNVEPAVVAQANGSSRVVVGGTQLLVGVRAELATPAEERPGEGIVLASVDSTAAFPPDSSNKDVDDLNALLERYGRAREVWTRDDHGANVSPPPTAFSRRSSLRRVCSIWRSSAWCPESTAGS